MTTSTAGIHHVTAFCGEPNRNAEFYVGLLGLRLVKFTVNHDDTSTLHLYYGDYHGTPGTNLTFFPRTSPGESGKFGAGQTRDTAYAIRPAPLDYWRQRLKNHEVPFNETRRFDDTVLSVSDPDEINIELVATDTADDADITPWADSPVMPEHQLRGFYGVTLAVDDAEPTERVLTDSLGYERIGASDNRIRLRAEGAAPASIVDIAETDLGRGKMGIGTVHHVAFSVDDLEHQDEVRRALIDAGLSPTDSIDRRYFQSIYCREPGGTLFEFATMSPGFTADEDLKKLGMTLVLPEWLEDKRDEIEASIPDFTPPS